MKNKPDKTVTKNKKSTRQRGPESGRKNDSPATPVVPLTWTAREYVPRKRWWWFVGLAMIALWFSLLLIVLREWYVLAFVLTATVTLFVLYLPKPRLQTWTLDGTRLTVDKTVIKLENYRAFTIEELPETKTTSARSSITLLPKRRLGWPFPVYLPHKSDLDASIMDSFGQVLPYSEADQYQTFTRMLNHIARWTRLG